MTSFENWGERELAIRIDHTLIRPDAVKEDFAKLCVESVRYGFLHGCGQFGGSSFVQEPVWRCKGAFRRCNWVSLWTNYYRNKAVCDQRLSTAK